MKNIKKEFETLIYQSMASMGFDDLSSKILGILYSSTEKLTLNEITKETGYSFSAISVIMKNLVNMQMVESSKKSGSKRLYFTAKREMMKFVLDRIKMKNEVFITPILKEVPGIIERCKKSKEKDAKEMLKILEPYYVQMIALDKIMKELVKITNKVQKGLRK
jgi:DNA-binding transcriptional regulator GbsR (MarR family)